MAEYATRDIANIVGIAAPTVRKYALALEEAGYQFMKDGNDNRGTRIFRDEDIYYFQELTKRSNDTGMAVKQIATILVLQQKRDIEKTEKGIAVSDSLQKNELQTTDTLHMPEEFKQFFRDEMKSMKESIVEELKDEIVQDLKQELVSEFRRALEETQKQTQLQIAAAFEEEKKALLQLAAAQEEKKKGFFSRLFGK
jgi:DNA-binding transcriptional MerR regulator